MNNRKNSGVGKLSAIALVLIALLVTVGLAVAVTNIMFPQSADVGTFSSTVCYLDDVVWNNGTLIAWGPVVPGGVYGKNFTVYNAGNINANYTMYLSGLPVDWAEVWTANGTTVLPKTSAVGTLTLWVPLTAANVTYSWNSMVTVT
jgi:hypothetical protein